MSLMPKRVRWRKQQRGSVRGNATRGHTIAYGEYGVQSLGTGWITAAQIEAARVAATRALHGTGGRLYIRIFPHKPIRSIPLETRMGKGKGEPDYWAATVKPGTVLYEIGGVAEEAARLCFARLAHKMPVRVRMIKRRTM